MEVGLSCPKIMLCIGHWGSNRFSMVEMISGKLLWCSKHFTFGIYWWNDGVKLWEFLGDTHGSNLVSGGRKLFVHWKTNTTLLCTASSTEPKPPVCWNGSVIQFCSMTFLSTEIKRFGWLPSTILVNWRTTTVSSWQKRTKNLEEKHEAFKDMCENFLSAFWFFFAERFWQLLPE